MSWTCGCYIIWQKDFADVVKVKYLKIKRNPGLPGWAQSNYMSPSSIELSLAGVGEMQQKEELEGFKPREGFLMSLLV